MTITEILSLPTEELDKMSLAELEKYIGPLIPDARKPDKENLVVRDQRQINELAAKMIAQMKAK